MDASEPRTNVARREAQPIPWDNLSSDQKEAVKQAAGILADLAGAPNPSEENKTAKEAHLDLFLPQIDKERLNHVVLLDGDRGSGKTAVLVTLLDGWSRMLRNRIEQRHEGLVQVLKGTENIVPIGLIDLQPLPKSTNLLLYLVGRFQRVVEAIEQVYAERGSHSKSTSGSRHAWHGVSAEEPLCAAKWRDLVHAAALGWNGDIGQRRGSLDPEAFVAELEQAEKRRLDIVSSFRHLIDALVKDYELLDAQPKKNPLFLLAIDDADMNPEKAAEALDLVRTLWHPRVAYLLTGDSNLFLAMLRHRSAKSLGDAKDEGSVNFANDLAVDIYNKAIPPVHRCRFYHLPPHVRLEKLEADLRELPYPDKSFGFLLNLFAANEQLQEALPSRERSVADLRTRINHELSRSESKNKATLNVIAALCRAAFAATHDGPGEHIPHFKPEEDLIHAARTARNWRFQVNDDNTLVLPNDENDENWTLFVQRNPRWEATDAHGEVVSNARLAAGMLARELVAISFHHRESSPRIRPLGLLGAGVRIECNAGKELFRFAWPLPDWPNFGNYFEFGRRWAAQVPKAETYNDTQVDELGYRFLQTVAGLLQGAPKDTANEQLDWDKLAKKVAKLAKSTESEAAYWALSRAGLLAAPESGLGHSEANKWLEALKTAFDKEWNDARRALKSERLARVHLVRTEASTPGVGIGAMLASVDTQYKEYKWNDLVEREPIRATVDAEPLTPLFDALKTIATPWWPSRPNLASYFDLESRKSAFEKGTSRERLNALIEAVRPYQGRRDVAAEAIVTLWRAERQVLGVASPDIEVVNGRIVAPTLENAQSPLTIIRTPLWRSSYDAGTVCYFRLSCHIGEGKAPEKQTLLGVLLRGIFDMRVDAIDTKASAVSPPPCKAPFWPGFGTYTMANSSGYQWPAPGWPTCYDWERLANAWNRAVESTQDLARARSDNIDIHQRFTDGLMYWLMLSIPSILRENEIRTPVKLNLDIDSFINDCTAAVAQRSNLHATSRAKAYSDWCNNLPLFAAPESGLSRGLYSELLGHARIVGDLEKKAALLKDLRVARAIESGIDKDYFHRELASIDGANPDHPWVQLFGPHTAP